MPAERAEHFLVAHFLAPVVLMDLELEQALGRRALPVEIALVVGRQRYRDPLRRFKAPQFAQQFVKHRSPHAPPESTTRSWPRFRLARPCGPDSPVTLVTASPNTSCSISSGVMWS